MEIVAATVIIPIKVKVMKKMFGKSNNKDEEGKTYVKEYDRG
ncbi:MAG: hypothetical protein AB2421_01385 [Thermotaleaceae bacterium]